MALRLAHGEDSQRFRGTALGQEVPTDDSEQKPWSACFRLAASDTSRCASWRRPGQQWVPEELHLHWTKRHLPRARLRPSRRSRRPTGPRIASPGSHQAASGGGLVIVVAVECLEAHSQRWKEGQIGLPRQDLRCLGDLLQLEQQARQMVGQSPQVREMLQRPAQVFRLSAVGLRSAVSLACVQGELEHKVCETSAPRTSSQGRPPVLPRPPTRPPVSSGSTADIFEVAFPGGVEPYIRAMT